MKRTLLSLAALAFISTSAMAVNFGDTTNNQGGAGGAGGNASATAGAAAAASATAGASATNITSVRTDVSNVQGQQQGQIQGQAQKAVSNSGGNVITVEAAETYRTAATAYAAPLTASNGTCMGSSSVGAQGTFGLSFGTTWTDDSCDLRYDAQALQAVGQTTAALARLCQKAEIAAAMEAAGTKCPVKKVAAAAPAAASAPVAGYTGNDPIVRARLAAK